MPKFAIISVGEGNQYKHPNVETLDLLNNKWLDAKIYRTDKNGNITVRSDGKNISIETSK